MLVQNLRISNNLAKQLLKFAEKALFSKFGRLATILAGGRAPTKVMGFEPSTLE